MAGGVIRPQATTKAKAHGTQSRRWVINGETGLYLDRTQVGWGVFAAKSFAAGEHILTFAGPEISLRQTLELGRWSMYPIQIGEDRYIDCRPPAAFLNHSCEPNGAVKDTVRLVAGRAIQPGEEITMDYSTTMSGDCETGMTCLCGSPRCRKVITNFEDLPVGVREDYLKRRIVSGFIAARRAAKSIGPGARLRRKRQVR